MGSTHEKSQYPVERSNVLAVAKRALNVVMRGTVIARDIQLPDVASGRRRLRPREVTCGNGIRRGIIVSLFNRSKANKVRSAGWANAEDVTNSYLPARRNLTGQPWRERRGQCQTKSDVDSSRTAERITERIGKICIRKIGKGAYRVALLTSAHTKQGAQD